ncbi:hypothetical protein JD292_06065 [Leucobacter sp. CSA2]|uniref:Uncharacterized protein n=1 Tax=Leucobacter edaphi TaxID=2796472 RepID=A0A934QBH6_9MICO|nr:DUF6541 family protein [Leucobacter edaphi]MBK0421635.1 hypothetical protein [Leucobacter edaphi]
MSAWLSLLPPLLTALAVLAVLGLPVAAALRLRGFMLVVVALPAAFAVIAISAIIAPLAKLSWSVLVPLGVTAVLTLVLLLLGRWLGPRGRCDRPHRAWIPLVSAALGGLAIAATLMMSLKSADAVSQTYDANFHLNAVRQILETGNASPFALNLSAPGTQVFYPALWHGFVALIVQVSGASIPLATNALVFAVVCVVWPIGMVALGRAFAGPSTRVSLISGVLSVAFPSFPLALVGYGVLYPNLLSMVLVPFVLLGILQLLGLAQARRSERSSAGVAWLLFLGALGAAVLAHPNAIHITVLWLIAPTIAVAVAALTRRRVRGWDGTVRAPKLPTGLRSVLAVLSVPALAVAIAGAWYLGRTSDNPWRGLNTPTGSLIDALGMTPHLEGHSWPVTLLFLIGVVVVWRAPRYRWLFGTSALFLVMYVIADGMPKSGWRTAILAPWYSDPWRISALVWIGVFPIVVYGASAIWAMLAPGVLRAARRSSRPRGFRVVAVAVAAVMLLAATQGAGAFSGTRYVSSKYETANELAPLLSQDERALLERLPKELPKDAVIIDNPWNGGALAYAISGVRVLVPHTGGTYDPRIQEMTQDLSEGSPQACALVKEFKAYYVLDFGDHYVFPGTPRAKPYAGITDVEDSPVLTEIDREGDAVLYQVTGC